MVTLIRPRGAFWSGVLVEAERWGDQPGVLAISVSRLSWRDLATERRVQVPLAALGDAPFPVYWQPIPDSAAAVYVVRMRQLTADGANHPDPPLRLSMAAAGSCVFSAPDPSSWFPEGLLVSPLSSCNLNCIHCLSRHTRTTAAEMGDTEWAELTRAAGDGALRHIRSDYSGDLFFADERRGSWLERITALDLPFGIDTHANDLTDGRSRRLLASRLTSINMSLDTLDADDYPRIRRGARPLAEVLDNIRRFVDLRNRLRPDVEVVLSFVLMRRTLDTLDEAIALAAELGRCSVIGNHLQVYTPDMADESLMLEPGRYRRAYAALTATAFARGVALGLPPPVTRPHAVHGHAPCPYPWTTAVVLGNGDVMACCVPGTTVGNVRGSSLEAVWNGQAMRAFRQRVNSDDPPDACRVCPMLRVPHNFASYAPGLSEPERQAFERRCIDALARDADD